MALSRRAWLTFVFLAMAIVLYVYGVVSASHIPFELESVVLPLDFLIGVPGAFYLMVVRPRKLSLLCVLPIIWVGYGLSAVALGSLDAGILPVLLAALLPVEAAIAARGILELARIFKAAKTVSADPMQWFYATTHYLVRKEIPAQMMAAELSVWYYALFSWRKKPAVGEGEKAYCYHNAGGYMNMMLGLGLAFPVEIVAVHMLLAQWSMTAAVVVTLLSIYTGVWLIGDARARVLRPIVLSKRELHIEYGIQMEAIVQLGSIDEVLSCEPIEVSKTEKLNYGTFCKSDVWLLLKRPVEVRTLLGTKRARAIGFSLDDTAGFMRGLKSELL